MKAILFGASGQLGRALLSEVLPGVDLVSAPRSVDLAEADAVASYVMAAEPDWVINAAAMTDVDGAHMRPVEAFAVNGLGAAAIAQACAKAGSRMIQVSTEAVFDGEYLGRYTETDACRPVSAYGASKLAGEHLVRVYSPDALVIRTSWLYAQQPGANFPTRLLDKLRSEDGPVKVVTDVVGNPTPASLLARALMQAIAAGPMPGTYHVCCEGAASKHDWARLIARSAGFDPDRIEVTTSDAYVTIAARPRHVDLDTGKFQQLALIELPSWEEAWLDGWSAVEEI